MNSDCIGQSDEKKRRYLEAFSLIMKMKLSMLRFSWAGVIGFLSMVLQVMYRALLVLLTTAVLRVTGC